MDAQFEFYEKVLSGTQELKPRWKRAMAFTEHALGEALGKLYCAKFFVRARQSTPWHPLNAMWSRLSLQHEGATGGGGR